MIFQSPRLLSLALIAAANAAALLVIDGCSSTSGGPSHPDSGAAAPDAGGAGILDSGGVDGTAADGPSPGNGGTPDASDAGNEGAEGSGCAGGEQLCDGGCTSVVSNNSACGSCGVTCSASQTCVGGACVTPVSGDAGTECDPSARSAFPVVVAPDGVYLIEGIPVDAPAPLSTITRIGRGADGGLDLASCTTTTGTVPIAEYAMGLAQAGSNVYLVSGATSTGTQPAVYGAQIADGGLTPFSTATLQGGGGPVVLQVSRYGAAVLQTNNYVYVIGGWSSPVSFATTGQDLAEIERAQIDPVTGAFVTNFAPAIDPATHQPATLALPRFGAGMLYHQGSWVYLLGGQTGVGESYSNVVFHNEIQRASLDASGNLSTFTQVGTLPTNLAGATAYVAGGTLYLLGGGTAFVYPNVTTTNAVLQASIAADGSLGAFTASPLTLAYAEVSSGSAVVGQTLYLFGGINATGFYATSAFETFGVP